MAAAGEVKSRLTTGELDRAIAAGIRFKGLQNTHSAGDEAFASPVDLQRFYECPPFFVVAMESNVNEGTILERLHNAGVTSHRIPRNLPPGERSYALVPPVDAVFILGVGAAIFFVDGSSMALQYPDGSRVAEWVFVHTEDAVLIEFLAWLHGVMPRVRRRSPVSMNYMLGENRFTTISQWAAPQPTQPQ
nr:hypothetical protein [Micromonospora rosaria]